MGKRERTSTLLLMCQVYPPDPAAMGQYLAEVGEEMVRRGHRVVAITSDRGYDDPAIRYRSQEVIGGVRVRRVPVSSFGKSSIALRLLAGSLFTLQSFALGVFSRDLAGILVSTAPPVGPLAALAVGKIRRVPVFYWVMDLNPDEMIVLGRTTEGSLPARLFDLMNKAILRQAASVIVLDRFMAGRIRRKGRLGGRLSVIPPWPLAQHHDAVPRESNPFRERHGWGDRLVVMYSGNHGLTSPTRTFLDAALAMQDREDVVFAFVGGGVRKREVDEAIARERPRNIVSLPYQPLQETKDSLSAADVHVVSVGTDVVGIVHPSKVYGAMALARPILYLGPTPSHVTDIARQADIGWSIEHGDVDGAIRVLDELASADREALADKGKRARQLIDERYNPEMLRAAFCDTLERGLERDR